VTLRRTAALIGLLLVGFSLLATSAGADTSDTTSESQRVESLTAPKAVVLGIVEGLTEYLPISSTGHLLIAERIMDVGQKKADEAATDTYTVVIQLGAILAVLGVFWKRFVQMAQGLVGRSDEGRSLLVSLIVAFVPAVVIALVFQDPIKERLLKPWPVVAAWIVGGIVILVFVANQWRFKERFANVAAIPLTTALGIGCFQALALWPGVSRSFVTIMAAILLGVGMTAAVEFSFLLGFVTLSAATAYELLKNGSTLIDHFGVANPLIGVVVAGVAAFIAVKWMVGYLEKHPLTIFGWYRIGVGVLIGVLLTTGAI
jgi:undecaprenyl-diphosphatase